MNKSFIKHGFKNYSVRTSRDTENTGKSPAHKFVTHGRESVGCKWQPTLEN